MKLAKNGLIILLALSLLAACSPGAPQASIFTATSPVVPTPENFPLNTPTAPDLGTVTPIHVPDAVSSAVNLLAKRLGIAASDVQVVLVEEVQWPDGCLGAGLPDEACLQVLVDGFRVVLGAGTQQFEFHTNATGSQVRDAEAQPAKPKGEMPMIGAAVNAQQYLAQLLGLNLEKVKLISVQEADWPDSCLGAAKKGQVCAQVITPGYRVLFLADQKQYEVRTDQAGGVVVLANEPPLQITGESLTWEMMEKDGCRRLEAGAGTLYGPCAGPMAAANLSPERYNQLAELFRTFSSFTADTQSGKVEFFGQGRQVATISEQRSLGEWAKIVFLEAQSGRSEAALGLVLSWHREGGIAGFCDDLAVYSSGWAVASSCRGAQVQTLGTARLTGEQLDQIYEWVDHYQGYEYNQKDPAAADALAVQAVFNGMGSVEVSPEQQQEMLLAAQVIYAEAAR